jgi:hypothetical protein
MRPLKYPCPTPAPPAYTSGCGNVNIEAGDTAPVVKLSAASVRLPACEIADLIAYTARDAAGAMRTDAADEEAGPGSAVDALAELKNLRDGADGQVTVEATGTYPVARLLLGLHAREMGPDLLAEQITETVEHRDALQRSHIDAAGLPRTMDQIDGLPGQMSDYARKVSGQAAFLQHDYEQHTRRFKQ